ncbi:MAG: sigma-70 family RNA polymerase sigma factor, partial [Planctomycetales bacterium]|nr:sigma-70 family RNA polymerase sigma factor [Planctomycetales bacterium]
MESTSPSLLIRLQDSRDKLAWTQFVDLYTPLMFYWARKTGLNASDAADLVQDVLLQLVRKLPEFQYDRSKS